MSSGGCFPASAQADGKSPVVETKLWWCLLSNASLSSKLFFPKGVLGGTFFFFVVSAQTLEACLNTSSAGIPSRCLQNSLVPSWTELSNTKRLHQTKNQSALWLLTHTFCAPNAESAPAWLRQGELRDQSPKLQKTSSQSQLQFLHISAHGEPPCTKSILLLKETVQKSNSCTRTVHNAQRHSP